MNAGLSSKGVEELLALQANYKDLMAYNGHTLSPHTETVMSQRIRAIREELKNRRAMTSHA